MNFAKAAPSAPVKKPPGKIRRSSRAACLSYFFFYLRRVRQFSAITTSTRKPMTSRIPVMPMSIMAGWSSRKKDEA